MTTQDCLRRPGVSASFVVNLVIQLSDPASYCTTDTRSQGVKEHTRQASYRHGLIHFLTPFVQLRSRAHFPARTRSSRLYHCIKTSDQFAGLADPTSHCLASLLFFFPSMLVHSPSARRYLLVLGGSRGTTVLVHVL